MTMARDILTGLEATELATAAWAHLVVAAQTVDDMPPIDTSTREGHQTAVLACYLIARMARVVPTDTLLAAFARADSIGAILDPTAYLRNGAAMLQDKAMVEAVDRVNVAVAKLRR